MCSKAHSCKCLINRMLQVLGVTALNAVREISFEVFSASLACLEGGGWRGEELVFSSAKLIFISKFI